MAASAPTGCFKCGRPGHWSKDCPSSSSPNPNPNPNPNFPYSKISSQQQKAPPSASTEKPAPSAAGKKAPRTRPKLTPDLLLSEDGLGYVLRHFPKSFKYHGRGHEVSDLGNLIRLYAQWHSRLLPYYSFDQFIHKVEKVGATRRVGRCLSELRERVARGGDPTKLHETPVEEEAPTYEQGAEMAEQNVDMVDAPSESHAADEMQEEMIDEIYEEATNDMHEASQSTAAEVNNVNRNPEGITNIMEIHDSVAEPNKVQITEDKSSDQVEAGDCKNKPSKMQLTEEQMARMEANRQKALQRAAARASATQAV